MAYVFRMVLCCGLLSEDMHMNVDKTGECENASFHVVDTEGNGERTCNLAPIGLAQLCCMKSRKCTDICPAFIQSAERTS